MAGLLGAVGIVVELRQGGQDDLVHLPVKLPQPLQPGLPATTQDAVHVLQDGLLRAEQKS
jgi:hypothetical protein